MVDYQSTFQQPLQNSIDNFNSSVSDTMDAAAFGYTMHCSPLLLLSPPRLRDVLT